jgi:circadian clock protein KaiB
MPEPKKGIHAMSSSFDSREEYEQALSHPPAERYVLRLYVTGATRHSAMAIANLKRLCEQYLPGRYQLTVVDLYQQPELAAGEQLVVLPTLVKHAPLPVRRLVGSLSDPQAVLRRLDIRAA